ncbi:MAG TPA: copper resistance CopC family protein [Streptosporangiaceae bacterium]
MSYGRARRAGTARVIVGAGSLAALLGALLAALAALAALAGPAGAHTALKASSPKDGGTMDVAPSRLVMEFTEPILTVGYRVVVRGPDARAYQSGAAQIVDNTLTQPLNPLGPAGEYKVTFRVVAADGHPLTSGMRFTLTKPGPASGGAKAEARPAPLAAVPSNSVNNAPPWATWTAAAIVAVAISGAVFFGRRATHDLD